MSEDNKIETYKSELIICEESGKTLDQIFFRPRDLKYCLDKITRLERALEKCKEQRDAEICIEISRDKDTDIHVYNKELDKILKGEE